MEVFLGAVGTLAVLGYLALMIWFIVTAVRFLRSGRKAFDRYVALTQEQAATLRELRRNRIDIAPPA